MSGKIYRLFISHAWDYKDEYYRLRDLLNSDSSFKWMDYSVPTHEPLTGALRQQFDDRIRLTNAVLVLSGMYAKYSSWMLTELRISVGYEKPIIGIIPQGQDRVPTEIQDVAKELVRWNTSSIISAIKRHAI